MAMEPPCDHQASPYVLRLQSVDPVCYCHVGKLCMHKATVSCVSKALDGAGDGDTAVDLMTATAILARIGTGQAVPCLASTMAAAEAARPSGCCLRL
jgi:hypothetical protein